MPPFCFKMGASFKMGAESVSSDLTVEIKLRAVRFPVPGTAAESFGNQSPPTASKHRGGRVGVMSAPEETSPLELGTVKGKRNPSTHKWKQRWEREVPWIHALLAAADNGGVAAYWRDKNPHGKKTSVADNLRKKLAQVAPVAEDEELPSGRQLLQRVEAMVLTWRAGEARKNAMNDSQWQAAVKQQCEDPPLRKGVAGFKEWDEIREYLKLVGWVDAELEDNDPRCPSAADEEMVAAYKEVLAELDDALSQSQGAKASKKEDRTIIARAEATRDKHGLAAERYAAPSNLR